MRRRRSQLLGSNLSWSRWSQTMIVPDEAAPLPEPLPPLVGGGSVPELLPVDVAPVPVGGRGCGFRPQSHPTIVAKAAASSSAIARLVLVTPMAPGPFKHTMCQLRNVAEVAERSTMRRNLPMTADPRMAQLGTLIPDRLWALEERVTRLAQMRWPS